MRGARGGSIVLALSLLGCDGYVGAEDQGLGQSQRDQMSNGVANGLVNGIANGVANGLANGVANGVANSLSNGIANGASNGLKNGIANGIANGVNTAGMLQFDSEQQTGKFADYLVQCALSSNQSIYFPAKGSIPAHTTYGVLGLATDWYTSLPSLDEQARVSACLAARMNSKLQTMWFTGMGTADNWGNTIGRNWQAKTCDSGDGYKKLGEIHVAGNWGNTNIFSPAPSVIFATSTDVSDWGSGNYGTTRICGSKNNCPSNIIWGTPDNFTTSTSSSFMASYPYFHAYETCGGLSLYRHRPDPSSAGDVMTYVSCSTIYRTSGNTYCPPKCSYSECTSGRD